MKVELGFSAQSNVVSMNGCPKFWDNQCGGQGTGRLTY